MVQTVQVPQIADEHTTVPALSTSLSKPDGEGNLNMNMASAAIMLSASETLRNLTGPSMSSKHSVMMRISPGALGLRWKRGDCGGVTQKSSLDFRNRIGGSFRKA